MLPPPSLRFWGGLDDRGGEEENELATLELIHSLVEALDKYFGNVCELGLMYHIDKAHYILGEMIVNGCIVDTNKANILTPTRRCSALWNDVGGVRGIPSRPRRLVRPVPFPSRPYPASSPL